MTETIVQLSAGEFEEAIDFLNLVYSAYSPTDFPRLIPTRYRPTDEHMAPNYAIRKDGRIKAIVGMFPIDWQVGQVAMRVAGIGGVSTHPNWRGRGLMKALMTHCVSSMKEQGFHLSWLGGQRQRYGYFGYERCGYISEVAVSKANLKHCFDEDPGVRFEPLAAEDHERLARARALHDAQSIHCRRPPEDFFRYCTIWHHKPSVALAGDGRMVGYLVANDQGSYVPELHAESEDMALRMVRAWVAEQGGSEATFEIHPTAVGLLRQLGRFSEQINIRGSGNWQVFDWVPLLDALMKIRHQSIPMPKGEVVVGIIGHDAVRLQVEGKEAGAAVADELPDMQVNAFMAMRLLFGPLSPSQVMALPSSAAVLESWCPLPLSWPRQDGV